MVVGVEQMKTVDPAGGFPARRHGTSGRQGNRILFPSSSAGRDEYDRRFGLKDEHLAHISAVNYSNAKRNPLAQTRNWYMTEPHANVTGKFNTVIGGRIKVSDCSQVTDGAVSLFLLPRSTRRPTPNGAASALPPRMLGWGHRTAPIARHQGRRWKDNSYVPATPGGRFSTPRTRRVKDVSQVDASRPTTASPPPSTWPSTTSA
jgi:acetyl-CoA C-acetyltransferase